MIAAIVVTLPFGGRPVSLPVGFALWTTGGPTKQVLLGQLVTRITAACPGRQIHVVADSWYAGADGAAGATLGANRQRGLPAGVTLTSRLRANAKLHAIAEPTPGKGGRPKRIGAVLGTPKQLAAATTAWTPTQVTRYGRRDTVDLADTRCLWYGVYRSRAVRVILLREPDSTAKAGHDLALITTDLTSPAEAIVARYAARWSIDVAIADAKQITGVGQARNRTPHAVTHTVPFGLIATGPRDGVSGLPPRSTGALSGLQRGHRSGSARRVDEDTAARRVADVCRCRPRCGAVTGAPAHPRTRTWLPARRTHIAGSLHRDVDLTNWPRCACCLRRATIGLRGRGARWSP